MESSDKGTANVISGDDGNPVKRLNFACERCRGAKRKCDGLKPICSLCLRQSKTCVYKTEVRPRKRKYWDEDYVHALEDQVQSLLAMLEDKKAEITGLPQAMSELDNEVVFTPMPFNDAFDQGRNEDESKVAVAVKNEEFLGPTRIPAEDRSQISIDELAVMMWRTNVGDGVSIIPKASATSGLASKGFGVKDSMPKHLQLDDFGLDSFPIYASNRELTQHFAEAFLAHINPYHQFVRYNSAEFLEGFPYQPPDQVFLHCAILAAGACFSNRAQAGSIGEVFCKHAAENLAIKCCRDAPSLAVVQALCILTWRELASGRDSMGWMYVSMASAMCVHLRLHVLALNEVQHQVTSRRSPQEIRTFWTFYIIDRTAVSIFGRNCALPWSRVNVPDFEDSFCGNAASLAEVSFGYQCKLWYLHDEFMEQIYASSFESLPAIEKCRILVTASKALVSFYKSHDPRLRLRRDAPPVCVLLFHMSYQMSHLLIHPPFLKVSTTVDPHISRQALRSTTAAACAMVRLVRTYFKVHTFENAGPVLIHHILSAAVVHLMNATSGQETVRKQSTRLLHLCMDFLYQMHKSWPPRAEKSIMLIQALASRWKVEAAVSIHVPNRNNHVDIENTSRVGPALLNSRDGEPLSSAGSSSGIDDVFVPVSPLDLFQTVTTDTGANWAAGFPAAIITSEGENFMPQDFTTFQDVTDFDFDYWNNVKSLDNIGGAFEGPIDNESLGWLWGDWTDPQLNY